MPFKYSQNSARRGKKMSPSSSSQPQLQLRRQKQESGEIRENVEESYRLSSKFGMSGSGGDPSGFSQTKVDRDAAKIAPCQNIFEGSFVTPLLPMNVVPHVGIHSEAAHFDVCEDFVRGPDRNGSFQMADPWDVGNKSSRNGEMKATVDESGFVSFHLRCGVIVNMAPNYAIEIINTKKDIRLALSCCATQMALIHPQGRVLQYNSRIEVQSRGFLCEKSAKIWPRGISFSSDKCVLVYLVDDAGARSTSDFFHDLYAEDITNSIFSKSCELYTSRYDEVSGIQRSIEILENVSYWQSETGDCWMIDDACIIQQTFDGFVSVERKYGNELFTLKTSPSNGKARLQSSFVYVTASLSEESHLFVKSNDRRIHHSKKAFVVRNAGHSAGFDEKGLLRIW